MRLLIYIALALSVLSPCCASAAAESPAPTFFFAIPDLPLMPGLRELTDRVSVFDKPEGRIVEVSALIESGTPQGVESYYDKALPAFGWRKAGRHAFVREQERLQMSFEMKGGNDFVKVILTPR